jgi:hypothetical protein
VRHSTTRFLAGATLFYLLLLFAPAWAAPRIKFKETVLGKRPPLATPRMGFSPDGTRVGWAARDGVKERIEINGIAVYTAEKTDRIFFTPDSKHSIVLERRGPKWIVAFDARAGSEFDRVQNFIFSPAGDRLRQSFAEISRPARRKSRAC